MSIPPVGPSGVPENVTEVTFDEAVKKAQDNADDAALQDEVIANGVAMLAQTIIMPRMNEILSEATSDE